MRRLGGYTLVLVAAGLWATLGLFYKGLAASGLPLMTIVFFRAGIAALALFLLLLWRDRPSLHLTRNDALFFLAFGLVGVAAFYIVYIYAIDRAGMGVAAVLMYTAPVWVSLYSMLFWGERWTLRRGGVLLLAFVGCALVGRAYDPTEVRLNGPGILAGLGAGLTYGAYTVFSKVAQRRHTAWATLAWALGIGALFLLPLQSPPALSRALTTPSLLFWLVMLGLVPTLGGGLAFNLGLRRVPASNASIVATLEPVIAAALGWAVWGERMEGPQILGAALVLVAVVMLQQNRGATGKEPGWREGGAAADSGGEVRTLALYVHIPFCRTRCAYCAFNTYAGLESLIPAYGEALRAEIMRGPSGATAATVYFGGGTPSLLPPDVLARILDSLQERFPLPPDAEVTLEANPGTVDGVYLRTVRELGVNRLSLGVQSIHEDELGLLGRQHTWADVVAGVRAARAAGLDNVNLDLIYGLPGQSLARWQETLEAALSLEPDHLSLYALTLEEGTPLQGRVARGELPPPDDDLAAEMYEWAQERLARAGYVHYELSNWARSDRHVCRHNLTYWYNEPYLGLGAGASSWWGGRRWTNVRHPEEYIRRLAAGQSVVEEVEEIGPLLEMGETMMMGLRLVGGVSDARFRARFGVGLADVFGGALARLSDLGLLEWDGQTARLTPRGRLLGNWVFREFI